MNQHLNPTCELCRRSRTDVVLVFTVVDPMYLCADCTAKYRDHLDFVTTFFNRFHRLPTDGELESFDPHQITTTNLKVPR